MTRNILEIRGATTHNLKSVGLSLRYGTLVGITGISGGGKSSLAHETLYKLCNDEFEGIQNGVAEPPSYSIESAEGLIPALALDQKNLNTNPRSSIFSFLNLYTKLQTSIYDQHGHLAPERLKLNNPTNECPECRGLGYVLDIRKDISIQKDKTIRENPFLPWQSTYSTKKYQLLQAYCEAQDIPLHIPFEDLDEADQNLLLTDDSEQLLRVRFFANKKPRTRKLRYIGVWPYLDGLINSANSADRQAAVNYTVHKTCQACGGSRINPEIYAGITARGLRFADFLTLPIYKVLRELDTDTSKATDALSAILDAIDRLGLGYLSMSRAIPTLSGGELQKLKLANLVQSSIYNILVTVDEISTGVHPRDFETLLAQLKKIQSRGNTIVLVEHNKYFLKHCDAIYAIGPSAGSGGGQILPYKSIATNNRVPKSEYRKPTVFTEYKGIDNNNVKSIDLHIPSTGITAIVGPSGSGKSSVAEYISGHDRLHTEMVKSTALRGNVRSTLASYLKLGRPLANFFARYNNPDYKHFLPHSGYPAACSNCDGTGKLRFDRGFDSPLFVTCNSCGGRLFSEATEQYCIDGLSIADLYGVEIANIPERFLEIARLKKVHSISQHLGLQYLSLGRKVGSLSGGESKRLKLLSHLLGKSDQEKTLIIDEPGAGLDTATIERVMAFLSTEKHKFRTILLITHRPEVVCWSDYVVEMGPGSGPNGGNVVFCGDPRHYLDDYYKITGD